MTTVFTTMPSPLGRLLLAGRLDGDGPAALIAVTSPGQRGAPAEPEPDWVPDPEALAPAVEQLAVRDLAAPGAALDGAVHDLGPGRVRPRSREEDFERTVRAAVVPSVEGRAHPEGPDRREGSREIGSDRLLNR